MTKFKSMGAFVAAGALAGAALIGVPMLASAEETPSQTGASAGEMDMQEMGAAMSDPQFRKQMMSAMSAMMSDREMRQQMKEMMGNMGGHMGRGDMGRSGMGGMGGGMGSGGADSQPQDDPTP